MSTLIVNQIDQKLSFGDDIEGTTAHDIRKFFWPKEETSWFGFKKNLKQSYQKWNEHTEGIYEADDVLNSRWIKRYDLKTNDPRDIPREELGNVLYTPLPESARKDTDVYGIVHIVSPDNAKGTSSYRNRARKCVMKMVNKCIELAVKLKVSRLIIPEVCCDQYACYQGRLDERFAAVMRGAVIQCVRDFMKKQKIKVRKLRAEEMKRPAHLRIWKKPLRICLTGKKWDDSI